MRGGQTTRFQGAHGEETSRFGNGRNLRAFFYFPKQSAAVVVKGKYARVQRSLLVKNFSVVCGQAQQEMQEQAADACARIPLGADGFDKFVK